MVRDLEDVLMEFKVKVYEEWFYVFEVEREELVIVKYCMMGIKCWLNEIVIFYDYYCCCRIELKVWLFL